MSTSQFKGLRSAGRAGRNADEGFTLVELMVVVLVIAILLAIAIPTFLGARERSQDRSAQSNVRNALTAAKVAFSNDGDYASATHTDLDDIEPNLTYLAMGAPSDAEDKVSVAVEGSCSYDYSADQTQSNCTSSGTWTGGGTNNCGSGLTHRTAQADCAAGAWTDSSVWAGAAMSDSETCWLLRDNSEKSRGTQYLSHSTPANCTGTHARESAIDADW